MGYSTLVREDHALLCSHYDSNRHGRPAGHQEGIKEKGTLGPALA